MGIYRYRRTIRSFQSAVACLAFVACAPLGPQVSASASSARRWAAYEEHRLEPVDNKFVRRADGTYKASRWADTCPETEALYGPRSKWPAVAAGVGGFLLGVGAIDLMGDVAAEGSFRGGVGPRGRDQGLPEELSFTLLALGVSGVVASFFIDSHPRPQPSSRKLVKAYNGCLRHQLGLGAESK